MNLRFEVSGVGECVLTAERVRRGWVLYLRCKGGRKVYVKKLDENQARTVVDGDIEEAQVAGRDIVLERFGAKARLMGFNDPDKYWRSKLWTYSLGVWVDAARLYSWRRQGILIIKRKKGNQWAYYIVEKPKEWWRLLDCMPRRKAKMFRTYHYVASVPKEHLQLIFKRSHIRRIPKEDLQTIFKDLSRSAIYIMKWLYVEPHRFKPKASTRPSREDEGVLGELQSKAEDHGWGEVEEELAEDGEWETIEELKEEGYFDEEY
ncbi:MAG: hypothetical protein QXL91_02970 [Candidatus Bathyarchaeia archaeon]